MREGFEELTVAIDVRSITEKPAGIGVYVKNLVSSLAEKNNLFIYLFCLKSTPRSEINNVEWIELPDGVFFYLSALRKIRSLKIDVFHSPFSGLIPLFLGKKSVITVHDLIPQLFPKTSTLSSRLSFFVTRIAAKRAGALIAVSNSTSQDIKSNWKTNSPIFVTRPGISRLANSVEKNIVSDIGGYFLTVSTLEPRKNLGVLILAYLRALKENENIPDLYICGGGGWKGEKERLRKLAMPSNGKIIFLGYVPDEELIGLLKNCRAFFFPSLYEGVGVPPMEAALAGSPVICSNIPSLRELLHGIAFLIDPEDIHSWEKALISATNNPEWLRQLSTNNEVLSPISYSETASETFNVYVSTKNQLNTK